MSISVIVRVPGGSDRRLTFDGMQRVVIGRSPGSDVRIPEPSVSQRHASLRAQGADFVVVDEGSTNGTYVGDVRIAPNTSRLIRSGDSLRVGRVWLELRIDHHPVTRDLAMATRDLALAMVASALAAAGTNPFAQVRVVEGANQGMTFSLVEEGREYAVGRGVQCDLALSDSDVSREHVRIVRRADGVAIRDVGAKNGTFLGDSKLPAHGEAVWRRSQMVRLGRTVLALEEPLAQALLELEAAPDEPARPDDAPDAASAPPTATGAPSPSVAELGGEGPRRAAAAKTGSRWSPADALVMSAGFTILGLSLAGLIWLLRG